MQWVHPWLGVVVGVTLAVLRIRMLRRSLGRSSACMYVLFSRPSVGFKLTYIK